MRAATLLGVLLWGCEPEDGHALTDLVGRSAERMPTAVTVSWSANGHEGETFVEYGLAEDSLTRRTPSGSSAEATLLGLTAGHTWHFRAVTVDEQGERWESGVAAIDVAAPPPALPHFTIAENDASAMDAEALVFTSVIQNEGAWVVGLTRDGEYAWWYASVDDTSIGSVHPSADGRALVATHFADADQLDSSGVFRLALDGSPAELTPGSGHHDSIQLPDGRIAWIVNENPTGVVLEAGEVADLSVDALVENDEGAPEADAVRRFSFFDDYPHQPWASCKHFDAEGRGGGLDYTHANSIMYDEANDALLVMSKNLDALVSVDRGSGAIRWQAGGRYGDVVDVDGDRITDNADSYRVDGPNLTWWSHGHMSHFWGDGFMVFDNGYHHVDMVSRVVEYAFDEEAGTLQKVWERRSDSDLFNPLLGDARKLANGNYLLSWTIGGVLEEVTPENEVVWRASVELGNATGRVVYVPDVYHLE